MGLIKYPIAESWTLFNTTENFNGDLVLFIQLGSFNNREQAEFMRDEFKSSQDNIINSLNYKISLIDIKDKGIFYRLLAGPYQNSKRVREVCNNMKKNNINCFIIKEF